MQNIPATKNRAAAIAAVDVVLGAVIAARVAMAAAAVDLVRKGRAGREVFVRKVSADLVPVVSAAVKAALVVKAAAVSVDAMIVAAVFAAVVLKNVASFLRFPRST